MTYYNLRTFVVGAVIAILVAGVISYFASANPDGLEKAQEELGVAGPAHSPVEVPAVAFQEYNLKWIGEGFWSNAIAGVVPVYVVVQDSEDQWADINDGNHTTLLSSKSGSVQLLFKEEGVGDKWCLARLGHCLSLPPGDTDYQVPVWDDVKKRYYPGPVRAMGLPPL